MGVWWRCTDRWRRPSSPARARLCTGRCIWRWGSGCPSRGSTSPSRCWTSPRPRARRREDLEDLRRTRAQRSQHLNLSYSRTREFSFLELCTVLMLTMKSILSQLFDTYKIHSLGFCHSTCAVKHSGIRETDPGLTSDHQLCGGRDVVHRRLSRTGVASRVSELSVPDQQL